MSGTEKKDGIKEEKKAMKKKRQKARKEETMAVEPYEPLNH